MLNKLIMNHPSDTKDNIISTIAGWRYMLASDAEIDQVPYQKALILMLDEVKDAVDDLESCYQKLSDT